MSVLEHLRHLGLVDLHVPRRLIAETDDGDLHAQSRQPSRAAS